MKVGPPLQSRLSKKAINQLCLIGRLEEQVLGIPNLTSPEAERRTLAALISL